MFLLLSPPALAETLSEAFPPPTGAERLPADPWGAWLQALPLAAADTPVLTHDGRVVHHHARVIDLPLVPGDLQQCADSLIRLRGEWLRGLGQPVAFHATSGDLISWSRVQAGEVPYAEGNGLRWRPGKASWERYLALVFTWAGSASLQRHDTQATGEPPRPGDLLIEGGFPGHAVQILDVATHGARTWVLVAEGYMPAQSFHLELGPHDGWWLWEDGIDLGHWSFAPEHLRRWSR
jgi:hypothetical protein